MRLKTFSKAEAVQGPQRCEEQRYVEALKQYYEASLISAILRGSNTQVQFGGLWTQKRMNKYTAEENRAYAAAAS